MTSLARRQWTRSLAARLGVNQLEDRLAPAAFTPGNLVIYRVGDGAAALASAGTAVFLDEYTTGGTKVQSIAVPTAVSGANKQLVASGTSTSEGLLSLSTNGSTLLLTGYGTDVGTASITTSASTTINRIIGRVDASGTVDTSIALTDYSTGSNPRSVTSTNGKDIWVAGGAGGVRYVDANSGTPTTSTQVSTTVTNIRQINIFGGQLYASSGSGSFIGVNTVGTGLPTTAGSTIALLPGFTSGSTTPGPYGFSMLDLDAGVAGVDTLYVADDSGDKLYKFSLESGNWKSNGSVGASGDDYRGLTTSVSGSTVTLFATRKGNELVSLVDSSGYNGALSGTLTSLATAGTNTAFRGISFVPVSLPSLSINDQSITEGNSGTKTVSFTVSLNKAAPAGGVTFDIATANNTASAGSDYVARSLTAQTIPAGQMTYTFDVTVNGDTTIEGDESFFVNVTNVVGATISDGQGLGTIISDDPNTAPDIVGPATVTVQAFEFSTAAVDVDATDPDPQTLTYSISGGADKNLFNIVAGTGVVTFKAAPDFEFPADADMNNKYEIAVTVADGAGGTDTQTITVQVNNVNEAPTFTLGGDQTANEDGGLQTKMAFATGITVGPMGDLGTTVTFTVTNNKNAFFAVQPAIDSSGVLTYTPAADAFGTATVSVFAMDNGGTANNGVDKTATVTFLINLQPVNDAPDFTVGTVPNVFEDSATQTLPNFLTVTSVGPANETGQTTMVSSISNDNNALFLDQPAIDANGQLTYTPALNAFGTATVTVTVQDNGGTMFGGVNEKTRTFTITVMPVNDPPTFVVGGDQMATEDGGSVSVMNFITTKAAGPANETGQMVSFTATNNNNSLFLVQPAIDASGTLTYTLKANANGMATVSVRATDNGGAANGGNDTSDPQTFTITVAPVNDPPTFTLGGTQTVNEDSGPASVMNFLTALTGGPADESQAVTVTVTNNNNSLFLSQPTLSGGTLMFTPAANANGTATVTVKVQDNDGGTDTTMQTFTINVTAVNDAPSFVVGADQGVAENSPAQTVMNFLTMISAGPADEAGQMVTFMVSNNNTALFSSQPTIAPNGTLTYTPAASATGMATVTVVAMDNGGTMNGGVNLSAAQTFIIALGPVNDAPSFTIGANQMVAEDAGAQSVSAFLTNISAGPPDEATQIVTFMVMNNNATLFKVAPAIDSTGKLTYTPADNANGVATITVVAMDNGGTSVGGDDTSDPQMFTITVNAVNDAPTFTTLGNTKVLEDAGASSVTGFVTNVSAGPADEAMQTVTVAVTNVTNASLFAVAPTIDASGKLTYTPAADANGVATITVTATDDGGGTNTSTQTFTITVDAVNDAPTFLLGSAPTVTEDAGGQSVTVAKSIVAGPTNEAGQAVTFTVSTSNPGLFLVAPAVDANGLLTYTTNPDASGSATVMVTATDNGGTANGGINTSKAQSFSIIVTPVNDAPRFTAGVSSVTEFEDAGLFSLNVIQAPTAGAADETGQTFTYEVSTDNPGLFAVQPAIDANGVVTFTLAPDANGAAVINYTVRDSGGTANGGVDAATGSFPVTILPVNDAPTFLIGSAVTLVEDAGLQTLPGFANAIAAGPLNEAGQPTTFSLSTTTTSGDVSFTQPPAIDAAGNLTFQTAPSSNGTATVSVTLDDGNGGTLTQTFTITVTPVNDAPTATIMVSTPPTGGKGPQSIPGVVAISTGATNESDPVSVSVNVVSTTGSLSFTVPPSVDANGTLTYTAKRGSIGSAKLAISVSDGSISAPLQFVTINVDASGRYELVGYPEFAVGSDDGQSKVTFFNSDGSVRFFSAAFPGTEFGARIASADFTGDGVADLVIGSGVGRTTLAYVIDGVTQKTIFSVQPFEDAFTGGVYVAAGDVTGDRIADLIITPDEGGGPRARVFNGAGFGLIADYFAIDDPNFRGGARAAVGDLNADGIGDLVVSAGFGGGPRIAGYDGASLAGTPVKLFNDFFAFELELRNGVYLAVGDVDGDGVADIIAGGGPGGAPRVTGFNGSLLMNSDGANLTSIFNFFAGDITSRGGVRLGVKDLDGDTKADLIVGSGTDAGDTVTAYLGSTLSTAFPNTAFAFEAFEDFPGGVFVG